MTFLLPCLSPVSLIHDQCIWSITNLMSKACEISHQYIGCGFIHSGKLCDTEEHVVYTCAPGKPENTCSLISKKFSEDSGTIRY